MPPESPGKLASEMKGAMEPPTPGAVEGEAAAAAAAAVPKDKYDRPFNSQTHRVDGAGKPLLSQKNRLVLKPGMGGRPPRQDAPPVRSTVPPIPGTGQAPPVAAEEKPDFEGLARLTVQSYVSTMTMLLGEEWKAPHTEYTAMVDAWTAYYQKRGVSEVPPEIFLGIVLTGYAGARLQLPKTREQLAKARDRIFRRRRHASHDGDRTDGQRKNAS